ncbi:L-rhamnose-binding lectin CSL3-like [Micropterus salmoides]|uniref:L-rhamnose-binding lectin CSL3-like n=1 Tax=Micropterus salmoides TaxID=27706 RepID=UPI0018EA37D8|nr:L-rhamnose-binding lectin CSL3-like [Micropterus salmoides]
MSFFMLSTRLIIIALLAAAWCQTSYGNYDVACPGVNSELFCPKGSVIEVLSMKHGLKSAAICADRTQPAVTSEKNCIDNRMIAWVKLVCDNMEHCRLPKPHPMEFLCDYSSDNFILTTYKCNLKRTDLQTTVICQGQAQDITCEKGVLHIVKASFGRFDENTCTQTPSTMTYCASAEADERVKKMCNNKNKCNIIASPDYLGKPTYCDNLPMYLTVDYVCQLVGIRFSIRERSSDSVWGSLQQSHFNENVFG